MVSRNTRGIDFQPIVFGPGFALRNLLYDSTRWALPETRQKQCRTPFAGSLSHARRLSDGLPFTCCMLECIVGLCESNLCCFIAIRQIFAIRFRFRRRCSSIDKSQQVF